VRAKALMAQNEERFTEQRTTLMGVCTLAVLVATLVGAC
jgi:hypothetical protein